ncbi:hypothetical protein PR048_002319 [Dryococelus australis]|uniref:DDE Tnp4 domain-containing protein n=1 Tax=Dryococelus australis TaxID=614101 RepID=A0ABQ9IJW1_9NEOP|nr:hypothetical protein PR048_002319 [Dryococelus australis]
MEQPRNARAGENGISLGKPANQRHSLGIESSSPWWEGSCLRILLSGLHTDQTDLIQSANRRGKIYRRPDAAVRVYSTNTTVMAPKSSKMQKAGLAPSTIGLSMSKQRKKRKLNHEAVRAEERLTVPRHRKILRRPEVQCLGISTTVVSSYTRNLCRNLQVSQRKRKGALEWSDVDIGISRDGEGAIFLECDEVALLDKWNFNHCVGALDGKHVAILKPPGSSFKYSFYSYKTENWMIQLQLATSIPPPPPQQQCRGTNTTHRPLRFPWRQRINLSRARRVEGNAFGILTTGFRVLHTTIYIALETIEKILPACCVLHNCLSSKHVDNNTFRPGERSQHLPLVSLRHDNIRQRQEQANYVRIKFRDYFNNGGKVSYEYNMLRREREGADLPSSRPSYQTNLIGRSDYTRHNFDSPRVVDTVSGHRIGPCACLARFRGAKPLEWDRLQVSISSKTSSVTLQNRTTNSLFDSHGGGFTDRYNHLYRSSQRPLLGDVQSGLQSSLHVKAEHLGGYSTLPGRPFHLPTNVSSRNERTSLRYCGDA